MHAIDAGGEVVLRQRLTRRRVLPFFAKLPRCVVGIEACGYALEMGKPEKALAAFNVVRTQNPDRPNLERVIAEARARLRGHPL